MVQRLQRVLILYSTVSGCTETIARRIGVDLIAYGLRPTVLPVEAVATLDTDKYGAVILGSGLRLGRWHRDMRDWVARNKAALDLVPHASFTVGLHGVRPDGSFDGSQVQDDLQRVMAASGMDKAQGQVFLPGWKRTQGFSSMERIALRVYPLADGDYRDWDLVDSWVGSIVSSLITQAGDSSAQGRSQANSGAAGSERLVARTEAGSRRTSGKGSNAAASVRYTSAEPLLGGPSRSSSIGSTFNSWSECRA